MPEVPTRKPAFEKSTLNSGASTSPPNPPDAVEIGFKTLPTERAEWTDGGPIREHRAESVKIIV